MEFVKDPSGAKVELTIEKAKEALDLLSNHLQKNTSYGQKRRDFFVVGGFVAVKISGNRQATKDIDFFVGCAEDASVAHHLTDSNFDISQKLGIDVAWLNSGSKLHVLKSRDKVVERTKAQLVELPELVLYESSMFRLIAADFAFQMITKIDRLNSDSKSLRTAKDMDDLIHFAKRVNTLRKGKGEPTISYQDLVTLYPQELQRLEEQTLISINDASKFKFGYEAISLAGFEKKNTRGPGTTIEEEDE